jgi:hypothetical protein
MTTSVAWGWGPGGDLDDSMAVMKAEHEFLLSVIQPGMSVYDNRRHKIGTVRKVYPPYDDEKDFFLRAHTGILGLGHDLYVPSRNLTVWKDSDHHAQVVIGVERQQLHKLGWEKRPALIREE